MTKSNIQIDRTKSADRIRRDVETLGGHQYTLAEDAISRYAYTKPFRRTLDYFKSQLEETGFEVHEDPVGTLVARNRPPGVAVFALGSHCDSVRNGGKWDGTLGVAVAVEAARVARELGLDLPLQIMSFLEEDGGGFGQALLGSRIMARRVTESDLRSFTAIDDGRPFWQHAEEAGYEPARWEESLRELDDVVAWIETHIEQGRVLEDSGNRLGIVSTITGLHHADILFRGRADHAGATPMRMRADAAAGAAACVLELERLALAAGEGTVGTVGEIEVEPGVVNGIPGHARISLDIRSVTLEAVDSVKNDIAAFAERTAAERGLVVEYRERQTLPPTPMEDGIVTALEAAAAATGESTITMPSGGGHDTMCVADHIPVGMIFVPCVDGISHSPLEDVDPTDAALAVETVVNALATLRADGAMA